MSNYKIPKETKERVANIIAILLMIALVWLLVTASAHAQNVRKQGKIFIEQKDTITKGVAYETDYVYVDKDGKAYPIYLSKTGSAFITKVSKKSGKKYRKYLPDVTNMIRNEHK